jgi:hypothetical protein
VISPSDNDTSQAAILDLLRRFSDEDDVYSDHFKKSLVVQAANDTVTEHVLDQIKSAKVFQNVYTSRAGSHAEALPSGPYFVSGGNIHQAWRLYEDTLDAFVITVISDESRSPSR